MQSSRDAYGKVYVPGGRRSPKGYENEPGPDTYRFDNYFIGRDAVKYTLRSRTNTANDPLFLADKFASLPGPGHYKTIDMSSDGNYLVSTIP